MAPSGRPGIEGCTAEVALQPIRRSSYFKGTESHGHVTLFSLSNARPSAGGGNTDFSHGCTLPLGTGHGGSAGLRRGRLPGEIIAQPDQVAGGETRSGLQRHPNAPHPWRGSWPCAVLVATAAATPAARATEAMSAPGQSGQDLLVRSLSACDPKRTERFSVSEPARRTGVNIRMSAYATAGMPWRCTSSGPTGMVGRTCCSRHTRPHTITAAEWRRPRG
jgi:hypothetical protein